MFLYVLIWIALTFGILGIVSILFQPKKFVPQPITEKTFTTDDVLDYHFRCMDEAEKNIQYWENLKCSDDDTIYVSESKKNLSTVRIKFHKAEIAKHQKSINQILKD